MSDKIVLIDGHSILNRAFYGIPHLTNSEGIPTNAVYGFLNILFKILDEEKPQYLTVAFDLSTPTFRHENYAAYKGTRSPMPEDLREQVPLIKEVLTAMGVHIVTKERYEADDIIGTIAKRSEKEGKEVTVLSGDRDLLQLATDKIMVRIPKTAKGQTTIEDYHTQEVIDKYGLSPMQIIDLKGLMGDASDNIPGVPGVGEKTATKILTEFGSVENAYEHIDEIKPPRAQNNMRENKEQAYLSKELATIDIDAPIDFDWEHARLNDFYTSEAYEIFRRLDFKNLLVRFDSDNQTEEEPFTTHRIEKISELKELLDDMEKEENIGVSYLLSEGLAVTSHEELLLGIALSSGERTAHSVLVGGDIGKADIKEALVRLSSSGSRLILSDVKQLMHVAGRPLSIERSFDTALAAYLLDPLKSKYTYDDIAKEHAKETLRTIEDIFGGSKLPKDIAGHEAEFEEYLSLSAHAARISYEPLKQALFDADMLELYMNVEFPLSFTLYDMEREGIKVNGEELKKYGERLTVRITELEKLIYDKAGEEFNINSPKQLGVILFEKMKLPGGKKTKTGYSTAADVLERLAEDAPIIKDILEYRQLTKLKSTYADGLYAFIADDGRIHSTFNQTIAATGRISSTDPNLQNIPIRMELGRMIRKVFVPKEGCLFIDADYSQIELRVLAHLSGDEKLIEAYRMNKDIHRITASQVFHVPFEDVTPLQRRNAKAVNFGIVYGISSFGLSQDLSISRKEAQEYIEKYFKAYPKIKSFLDKEVSSAKETGYAVTMFKRRRPVPELKSSNFMQRSFGERVAMNAPIQGSAADIIKIAMNRVGRRLIDEGLKSRLLLQIHDELLIEAPIDEVPAASLILSEEMESAADLLVKLEIDLNTGTDWYDAH